MQFDSIQEKKKFGGSLVWVFLSFVALVIVLTLLGFGPPPRIERFWQRRSVLKRVQAAGGWEVLRRESENLVTKHSGKDFLWYDGKKGLLPLPPILATLKPQTIQIDERPDFPPIVRIKFYGMWRTGAQPTPYYAIWVLSGTPPVGFDGQSMIKGNLPFYGVREVHCVTNQIYEVY